jgi:serine protease
MASRTPSNGRALGWLSLLGLAAIPFVWRSAPLHGPDPVQPERAVGSSGVLVVDLVDGSSEADLASVEAEIGADLGWVSPLTIAEGLAEGTVVDMDAAVARLASDPRVEAAEPEITLQAFAFPDDPLFEKQWNLAAMGAPAGWELTPRGAGVVVAVVDTGVTRVEDLEGTKILEGASFVPGAKTSADDQGHGTHVAGTIAQTTNNGKGVAGIAPAAAILPVKVLSSMGMGSSSWIAAGIDYATDQGADVINLSLGGGYSDVIHNAVKRAAAKGVIVVAAAGNSGREGVSWPGALPEAIGVSAIGPDGGLAPYSSWGKGVDIAGPGGDKRRAGGGILQDTIDGRGGHAYQEFQGTSMATPHVAGAAAVLLSTGLPPEAVKAALLSSADGHGSWDSKLGYGRLDLRAALGRETSSGGPLFALAAAIAWVVGAIGRTRAGYRVATGAFAGLAAAGVFFLPDLHLVSGLWEQVLSRGILEWPAPLVGPSWVHFPMWLSALIPGLAAITFGAFRPTRPIAAGLAAGIGAHLLFGAAHGLFQPWWLGSTLGPAWLGLNGAIALGLALALAGAQNLEERKR